MKLTPEDLVTFRDRFYEFDDGLVCEVEIVMGTSPRSCGIRIECADREADSGWSQVYFHVQDLQEFCFAFGRTTFEVLSFGIQFAWRGELVYVVLDAYPYDGTDLPDLAKNTAYVAGLSCEWSVTPIPPEDVAAPPQA